MVLFIVAMWPFTDQYTHCEVSSNPEDFDLLVQVCFARIGPEFCRKGSCQEEDLDKIIMNVLTSSFLGYFCRMPISQINTLWHK